ncbi:MAG: hypothetical protein QMD94_05005 [Candidatus Omnitrophota bacterium]|nr:hypothetical protein [Candidatus Omnitrophota bacterium]
MHIPIILIIGLSGMISQVLLMRELLISLYGNELIVGIILANWIAAEALGVFIIGRVINRIKNRANVFVLLQLVFSLTLPLSIYLSRIFKGLLGASPFEAVGLSIVFLISFLTVLPIGFCHGALFNVLCSIYSRSKESTLAAFSIGRVYALETIGTIIGGLTLTYLFIPFLNTFQIVFILSVFNTCVCLFFFKEIQKILKICVLCILVIIGIILLSGGIKHIQRSSINKQWLGHEVLDYCNSLYGNIAVTKTREQTVFFYNGLPVITTPCPDLTFVQEFGNLPLLFHNNPKNILVLGSGAGGLISEILKHPVSRIDYVELDPLLIKMLRKYPSELTEKELDDKRVNIIYFDARAFVKNTANKYDVILLGPLDQAGLASNRLFTQEFFSALKNRLLPDGIFVFRLSGSSTYISRELKNLNLCVLNGLKNVFEYVRIIPGDYNLFFASASGDIMSISPELLTQRIEKNRMEISLLKPAYLKYRLSKQWQEWFGCSLEAGIKIANQDLRPLAVFETLILWNKQFSRTFLHILSVLKAQGMKVLVILVFLITFLLYLRPTLRRSQASFFKVSFRPEAGSLRMAIVYCIAATGFFGMLTSLILIFTYQVYFGYLYHYLGLLLSVFMAGIASGSIIMTKKIEGIKNRLNLFIGIEACVVVFSLFLAFLLSRRFNCVFNFSFVYMFLLFVLGLLVGLEFPLACKIYAKDQGQGEVVGNLYAADLIGGCIAGLFGAVLLLPIAGFLSACVFAGFLKLNTFGLLFFLTKRKS